MFFRQMNQTSQITEMLLNWSNGNHEALAELMPVVYDELHKLAARYLRHERQNHSLQTTALIHEAYIKLIDQKNVNWQNRNHFFAVSSQMMRRILVDHARTKQRQKRGGNAVDLSLSEVTIAIDRNKSIDLIELDDALNRLKEIDERQVKVVELRYFSGLTLEETAEVLKISRSTVAEDWSLAKAWLHRALS
jgi:RNA polymerase sigma factor (TIGR02999 family)